MHMHDVYVQVCKGACAHAYMLWDDCGCLGLASSALLAGGKFSHWIWSNIDSQQSSHNPPVSDLPGTDITGTLDYISDFV